MLIALNKIIENKEELIEYLKMKPWHSRPGFKSVHDSFLKQQYQQALLCQDIMTTYDLSFAEINYIIKNNLIEINPNPECATCGKKLNTIARTYCYHKCSIPRQIKNKRINRYEIYMRNLKRVGFTINI